MMCAVYEAETYDMGWILSILNLDPSRKLTFYLLFIDLMY